MADERPCVFLEQSPDQDPEDEDRKHVLEVRLHPAGHLHAGSHIDLRHVLVEAPAIAGGAEEDEEERAAGKDKARDEEVFRIEDAACAQEVDVLPDIEAQDAGDGGEENEREQDEDTFLRLQPKLSMQLPMRLSKTAVTVEKLAKVMNRKKSPPQSCPIGILMKIFGSATKIRDGPSAGATPKAKQAGKMMRPAMMATKVSRIVMRTASPVSELSLLI